MATLRAAQHNPQLRTFYQRLRERGKPMKVARCATARKLLELAYAVVKNERAFDREYDSGQGRAVRHQVQHLV